MPLPLPGDRRAWDGFVGGDGWRLGVDAETRPRDLQALERRIALKQRDGGVGRVILLLADTEDNRRFVRANAEALRSRFPLAGRRALDMLAAGVEPAGNAVVLL